jgi:hypothetical protein
VYLGLLLCRQQLLAACNLQYLIVLSAFSLASKVFEPSGWVGECVSLASEFVSLVPECVLLVSQCVLLVSECGLLM